MRVFPCNIRREGGYSLVILEGEGGHQLLGLLFLGREHGELLRLELLVERLQLLLRLAAQPLLQLAQLARVPAAAGGEITRDCTPFLLILQGTTLQLQGIARLSFQYYKGWPSNYKGLPSLPSNVTREVTHPARLMRCVVGSAGSSASVQPAPSSRVARRASEFGDCR